MPISKHDKQGLADLFISMGVPLVIAMQTVESWSGAGAESAQKRAETLSKLLTASVEFATKITKKMDIRDSYTLENVRGKIIKIVTPIIAEHYITTGQLPESDNLEDITNLFDVLISFAETVSPTDEKASKQTKIALMAEVCDPLLGAIRENSFGMDKAKVFNDAVAGLMGRSEQLSKAYGSDQNAIENGLFKAILRLYVSCYKTCDDFDAVWKECDERIALLYGLTAYVGEKTGAKLDLEKPESNHMHQQLQNESKFDNLPDEKVIPKDNSVVNDVSSEDDDDFNPMSFFSAEK